MNNKLLFTSIFGSLANYLLSSVYPSINGADYQALIKREYKNNKILREKYLASAEDYYDAKEDTLIENAASAANTGDSGFKKDVIVSMKTINNAFKGKGDEEHEKRKRKVHHTLHCSTQ